MRTGFLFDFCESFSESFFGGSKTNRHDKNLTLKSEVYKQITEDSHLFQLPPGSRENRASRARLRAVNRRTHRVLRTKRRGVALPACKPADSRFSTNRDNIIIV